MAFGASWHNLLDELDALPDGATLVTPLSHDQFRITDVQEQRVVIEFLGRDIDGTRPLQRAQFETLFQRPAGGNGRARRVTRETVGQWPRSSRRSLSGPAAVRPVPDPLAHR